MENAITLSPRDYFEPLPKQKEFLMSALHDETVRYTWYVGGFGSGKSTIGCMTAIELSMMSPKNRGLIARSKFIDLKATTMQTMKELIEKLHLEQLLEGNSWTSAFSTDNSLLRFKNGSEIYFWGLDYRSDEQLKSLELGWFYLDEVNEIPESAFTVLRGRLRRPNVLRRVGIITSNPEGQNWTYQYFVNHTVRDIEGQKRVRMKEVDIPKFKYIVAPSTENVHLPEEYLSTLEGYQGIAYRRYVRGEFATYAGIIYDQLEPSVHYIPRFEVPSEWYDYGVNGALDYGMTNPTTVGKFAISPNDGSIILTDLFYKANSTIEQNAPVIRKMFHKHENDTLYLYADPATFNKNQEATGNELNKANAISVADRYWEHRIRFLPAKNAVMAGIETVKSYLSVKPERKHIISGVSPAPTLYIFDDLREVIDELSVYRWNPEVPDTVIKKDDHACLHGDSLILMGDRSEKKIKDIRSGDFVMTPTGIREVEDCKMTRMSKMIETELSNGEKIVSTPDHRVFVNGGHISTIDMLRYSDRMDSLFGDEIKRWNDVFRFAESDIIGMANTIAQSAVAKTEERDCISRFGGFIMGLFRRGRTSITETEIQKTIVSIISKLWDVKNIYRSISSETGVGGDIGKKLWRTLAMLEDMRLYGMAVRKVKGGTPIWLKKHGEKESQRLRYALYVAENMRRIGRQYRGFAIRTVKQRNLGEGEVYNLTVKDDHRYYSSDVLHRNCDMLRYYIATSPLTARIDKEKPQGGDTVSDIIKKQLKRISKEIRYGHNDSYDRDNTNTAFLL